MGWTWTCFGGRKERLRRLDSDGRVRHKNRERLDNDTQISTTPKPQSLAAQIRPKSPAKDSSAYDEPFQPKQVICGSLQGSKLFRRKTVRRANSLGSSSFENGAKKSCDKQSTAKISAETQPEVLVDRLQEEVEALRKRLAEEEAEARKLRNEVVYLRSCGVLQSPERMSCSSIERDSPSPGSFDRGQRHWQSWLGLTLSPTSRMQLEDQLKLMAAEEMSKNRGKGLTNGQKALIIATRLWHYQADDALHGSQVKFEHRDSYSSDTSSCFGNHLAQNQGFDEASPEKDVLPEGSRSRQLSKEAPLPECEAESTFHVASFRDSLDLKFPPGSSIVQEINIKTPPSSYESENFSFHPSSEKPVIKDVTVIRRAASFPTVATYRTEQPDGEFETCQAQEQVKFESPRRSCSLPTPDAAFPTSDEARRFIDLRYKELEEKLSKSPKRLSLSSSTATHDRSPPHPFCDTLEANVLDSLQQDSLVASSPNGRRFPLNQTGPESVDAVSDEISDEDSPASPSTPVMSKPFFSALSCRIWQPLSPVKEVDSGLSSVPSSGQDADTVFSSQKSPDDIAAGGLSTDSWTSEITKSSSRTPLHGSEQDGHDEASSTTGSSDGTGDAHDDDLFTLSPRRLNRDYDPWDDNQNFRAEGFDNANVDTSADSSTTTDWNTSEDSDFDILPIQCQSPDLSPKSLRSKFAKDNNELKLEYPRDKYLKEIGLKIDEMLASSDSVSSAEHLSAQKENQKASESSAVRGVVYQETPIGPRQEILPLSKSSPANDLTVSHDSPHPALASIENLPKWIEYQGIYVGPPMNNESAPVVAEAMEREVTTEAQRDMVPGIKEAVEHLNSVCTPRAIRAEVPGNDSVCARIQFVEGPELDTHQVHEEKGNPFYFEISVPQEKALIAQNTDENILYQVVSDKHHRYSPTSDCQCAKSEGERAPVYGMSAVIVTRTRQDDDQRCSPESGGIVVGKLQLDAHSSTKQTRETDIASGSGDDDYSSRKHDGDFGSDQAAGMAEKFDFRNAQASDVNHGPVATHSQFTKTEHVEAGESRDHDVGRANMTNLGRTPRRSVSVGCVEGTESPRESCSSNEVVESPGVGRDSGVVTSFSRDSDETAHSYESSLISAPTQLERLHETSFRTLIETSEPGVEHEGNNSDSGGSERDLYPVFPGRGLLSISPDDRPILGTVATWWADESLSKSRRWWDGQGIPNSTSKYKEDQRVNWHTTPFETRLEQALATQTTVPMEPSDQRNLFDGGVESVIESADSKDTDVVKPAARIVEVI